MPLNSKNLKVLLFPPNAENTTSSAARDSCMKSIAAARDSCMKSTARAGTIKTSCYRFVDSSMEHLNKKREI